MAFRNASAIRVCHPGPVAFHRARVSGGRRKEMEVRALPDLGRPRGFNIFVAAGLPKISGRTSRALRARRNVALVHTGFSRSALSELRVRFISFHLALVRFAKTDDVSPATARGKH